MMEFLHVTGKKSEIGFYSGLVDSTFAFGQLMTAFHWGRLSDRIGRLVLKPQCGCLRLIGSDYLGEVSCSSGCLERLPVYSYLGCPIA